MSKALVFPRLANNFIKAGYYPTDGDTVARLLSAIQPADGGDMRIIDPCAGEGVALAECKHHLGKERTTAYGIEYDHGRAWHAKKLLDHCIHGNFDDCSLGYGSYGLLFLNPPYGDMPVKHGGTEFESRKRFEKDFYYRTHGLLQAGGVLVLILPSTSFDKQLSAWIATHFREVKVFRAAVGTYKQTVLFGIKQRSGNVHTATRNLLMQVGVGGVELPELPDEWAGMPYVVPAIQAGGNRFKFTYTKLDTAQLQQELARHENALQQQFAGMFRQAAAQANRRPLRQMTEWHTALALAAGQLGGVVRAGDGRAYLIKGSTHKETRETTRIHEDLDGSSAEERIVTDVFVPVIRAIDFTPNSPTFGEVLMVR